MSLDPEGPVEYLIGHLEDALARDPRVAEQGLHVSVQTEPLVVVVSGLIVAARAQSALAEVISDLLPGVKVRDETRVTDATERPDAEEVW